ncbi:MAG: hypothetical protein R3C61_12110 [Bacteroidia bacterium]
MLIPFSCSVFRDSGNSDRKVAAPMQMILDLSKKGEYSTYLYIQNGTSGTPEKSKIEIEDSPEGNFYHHREIFSEYKNGRGGFEYSVIEFIIDVSDSLNRQKYEEYELVDDRDSVYISSVSPFEFLMTGKVNVNYSGKIYPIYRLDGYAHPGDPEPSHYKFWSPEFGIVLIWYGDGVLFELMESPHLTDPQLILAIKDAAIANL